MRHVIAGLLVLIAVSASSATAAAPVDTPPEPTTVAPPPTDANLATLALSPVAGTDVAAVAANPLQIQFTAAALAPAPFPVPQAFCTHTGDRCTKSSQCCSGFCNIIFCDRP